ncbi:MAG: FxsA family protein [Acidobacteria bacterium]|nr:MAG: FxsA family protein [Acidobacteriota bacterium]
MLLGLFFLFTLVPLLELYLLIRLGTYVGAVDTIAIVIGTGIAGGLLAKSQGLAVLDRMRAELNQGRLPAESLLDGLLILIAGAMLVTPGLLTDGLGLLLLIPWSRKAIKSWLKRKMQEKISEGEIHISTHLP